MADCWQQHGRSPFYCYHRKVPATLCASPTSIAQHLQNQAYHRQLSIRPLASCSCNYAAGLTKCSNSNFN